MSGLYIEVFGLEVSLPMGSQQDLRPLRQWYSSYPLEMPVSTAYKMYPLDIMPQVSCEHMALYSPNFPVLATGCRHGAETHLIPHSPTPNSDIRNSSLLI